MIEEIEAATRGLREGSHGGLRVSTLIRASGCRKNPKSLGPKKLEDYDSPSDR